MQRINVSEFKAVCLRLLEQIRRTGEPLEVLKNGQPLVVVYPPPNTKKRKNSFGALKSTVVGEVGDLTIPLGEEEWDVLVK